uniref:Lipocalin/cytosolic fatty-acid binding domain-containing protein n=1 Tax=Amblyomma maculatum TaxID=34609 RepID=G3MS68_AMBMU
MILLRSTAALFLFRYLLISSAQDGTDEDSESAWKFIGGEGENMYIRKRNFDPYGNDIIRCTMAARNSTNETAKTALYATKWFNTSEDKGYAIRSEYNTSGDVLTATQYFVVGNATMSSTNDYFFNFTDGKCAVVLMPHLDALSFYCDRACEMWVRDGSTDTENDKCEEVYNKTCGPDNVFLYNSSVCELLKDVHPKMSLK